MLAQRLLSLILSVILPCIVIAQDEAKSGTTCSFSCPATDKLSQPLVKRPYAVGFESFYSIFECIYQSSDSNLPGHIHTCSYYKDSGLQALGSLDDHCIPTAVACSTSDEAGPPLFSSQDKDEVPPWVDAGRYHLYLKEHHRG